MNRVLSAQALKSSKTSQPLKFGTAANLMVATRSTAIFSAGIDTIQQHISIIESTSAESVAKGSLSRSK